MLPHVFPFQAEQLRPRLCFLPTRGDINLRYPAFANKTISKKAFLATSCAYLVLCQVSAASAGVRVPLGPVRSTPRPCFPQPFGPGRAGGHFLWVAMETPHLTALPDMASLDTGGFPPQNPALTHTREEPN